MPNEAPRDLAKDVYVSSVPGFVVARHGSGTTEVKPQSIGCRPEIRTKSDGSSEFVGLKWTPDEVVKIPAEEFRRFVKEYSEELRIGSLVERTEADFVAWNAKQEAESAKDAPKKAESKAEKAPKEKS